ncbi:hypothetical protein K5E_25490 [Enterococcus thailandicus]|uniref:hypothetical protein n=1 Tax=Enterococcus thailandicus TaxID=417368 RepID=UPI00244D8EAC|nr:hypothetical protein [Enterococcus thailandicus]GMC10410.1 hypothetical protein K5E_25490 [Enterococcus thailandicus]
MKKSKIKSIKHKLKNGKLKLANVSVKIDSLQEAKELAFISAVADYLEFNGINEDVFDFLDEAISENSWKSEIAKDIAQQLEDSFAKNGISDSDVKSVKLVNKDAYESVDEFFKEEGLMTE